MPEKKTLARARKDRAEGKSPSTQAGEFVREEIHHVREGKHGARSPKQAIAIGLSKARRAGVNLRPPSKGQASEQTRKSAERDYDRGHGAKKRATTTPARKKAATQALKREGTLAASPRSLARQARSAAHRRSAASRSAAAKKAAKTRAKKG